MTIQGVLIMDASARRALRRRMPLGVVLAALLTVANAVVGAGSSPQPAASPAASPVAGTPVAEGSVTVYTSLTQDTVDAVLAALAESRPGLQVEVFRAPTGELDARIATEQRTGGIGADVLWLSDPLSMQRYAADGLLQPLDPEAMAAVAPEYRSDAFVGTRLLNLVLVAQSGLDPAPTSWDSLAEPAYQGAVALPDPGFAGSAFAALGYFADTEGYGLDFYRRLKDNGAVQVAAPGDVVTGVAEGRYRVGIAPDKSVADAVADGSPIELVWPASGAIAVYSPAAVVAASDDVAAAESFVEFLVSPEAQAAIASTGWQPIRDDVEWTAGGPAVSPDWEAMFGRQEQLLLEYRAIFGE
jgi:iron(III) transport system substrate-binding protein